MCELTVTTLLNDEDTSDAIKTSCSRPRSLNPWRRPAPWLANDRSLWSRSQPDSRYQHSVKAAPARDEPGCGSKQSYQEK